MRKINPLNDFAFKKIFGEKGREIELMSFLNAILYKTLSSPIAKITIIEHKELTKELIDDKLGIIDIRSQLEDGTVVNIEIQIRDQHNMEKRTVFYWSKLYTEGIKKGEDYKELSKVITINILDFNLLSTASYLSTFHLREDTQTEIILTDVMEIHFIEYPKFIEQVGENFKKLPITRWLKLLQKDIDENEIKELIEMEPVMAYVESTIDYITSDPQARLLYEGREKARLDRISLLRGAEEKGREAGREEGRKEGEIKGRKEGEIKGRLEGEIKTLFNYLKMTAEEIATELKQPLEQVQQIIDKLGR
ncbi:MAG: hypothetical protein ATN35_07960 [Epulopiscium sp. Nele67-Bin004]|nr:MAG: hypothetical protein ATN35_07960 [Epulopiscium sp. Nele67-Bin004]